jgi:CBS domain containing-hemolysin-like protein
MTTIEIIKTVAYVNVPEGATLVERDHPSGIKFMGLTPDSVRNGAGKLMEAEMIEESLLQSTAGAEVVNSDFFERLHEGVLQMRTAVVSEIITPAVKAETVKEFALIVAKIKEIAHKLGLSYIEPPDFDS